MALPLTNLTDLDTHIYVQVELALLSITESVELLAGVAELDGSQIPPQLLEISQLCGRLPLCLNIVGKLVFVSQITKNH